MLKIFQWLFNNLKTTEKSYFHTFRRLTIQKFINNWNFHTNNDPAHKQIHKFFLNVDTKFKQFILSVSNQVFFQNVSVLPWTESEEYRDFLKRLEDSLVWNGSDERGDDVGAALGPLSPRHLVSEGNISASSQIHTLKESKFQFTTLSL